MNNNKPPPLAIEFKRQRAPYPEKQRGCVLMPSMGAENMPDFNDIEEGLNEEGIEVITANLAERGTIQALDWDSINVIDLSNMRGCLTSFERYLGILDQLYDCIKCQNDKGHNIKIFPDFNDIEWISSKAKYLKHLENNFIPTIPTTTLCCVQNLDEATIITQPDNFDEMLEKSQDFMDTANTCNFVLKPSTSSLGRGLIFDNHTPEEDRYTISIPREEDQDASQVVYSGTKDHRNYLMNYFTNTPSPDHYFLLQEYVPNIETSAVFVDGTPHFVERLQGEKSQIAHARYGGKDTFIDNPDQKMVNFVYQVMRALPENIQNSPFLRIDVMKNTETGEYILGEIEGAGATRLWLKQADRVSDYAKMVVKMNDKVIKSSPLLNPSRSKPEASELVA